MKHNWISILAAAVLLLGACGRQYSPVEQAVIDHVQTQVGADSKLMVTQIAVEDSLTYGQLLEQRIKAFEVKYQQDNKFLEKSVAKNNIKKINQFDEAKRKDLVILDALRKMDLGPKASEVVCYDVAFSGKASTSGAETVFDGYYAAVSPQGEVLSLTPGQKGLHKGFGKFLPGYSDILDRAGVEDGPARGEVENVPGIK